MIKYTGKYKRKAPIFKTHLNNVLFTAEKCTQKDCGILKYLIFKKVQLCRLTFDATYSSFANHQK